MQVQIAVFGKNRDIVDTLERVINKNEKWKAYCTCKHEELKGIVSSNSIQIVLYSSGIGTFELENVENWVSANFPYIHHVQHFGGGSGLLNCEINSLLEGIYPINKPSINIID